MNKRDIIDYYEECESDYRLFWDLNHSLAMHAGYWDQSTKSLRQALRRENEILAGLAEIQAQDQVLDAGCGIGGSALYLAQRYGCKVTGISISCYQIDQAKQICRKKGLSHQVDFQLGDFTATDFPAGSFDVVWGLESICHTKDKSTFIKEAFRILKPGGRLIVADGFANESACDPQHSAQMTKWLQGFSVVALEPVASFQSHLQTTGFEAISFQDITSHVLPSSKRLFWISLAAFPLFKLGEWVGLRTVKQTANIRAAYYQYHTLVNGLWLYGIFKAMKPL